MIKVEQTELANYDVDPPVRGNCLAACVASIFEVDLKLLKGVYDFQSLYAWLPFYLPGVGVISRNYEDNPVSLGFRTPNGFTGLPGLTPWIASVWSPRTTHAHCVVMVADRLEWDPHPLREMGVGDQIGDYVFTLDRPEQTWASINPGM